MTNPDASRDQAAETPAQWARVRSLVDEALAVPHESRSVFLDASCGGDRALRERVGRLVDACDLANGSWGFLAQPAGELAGSLLTSRVTRLDVAYAVDATLPLRPSSVTSGEMLARLNGALGDRYGAEREIASGGMATVYQAHDLRHGRRVAIKVLHTELSAMLGAERFLSEIRMTAALQHPHILPLFDSGSADGLLFYVMPLVEGETLRARLTREKQLPIADAMRIAADVADALDYAHHRGIVHRDIKPENILLHDGRPLVADFGIALAVRATDRERMTRPGFSLGTPPYMSPEQAVGDPALDGRSDIYSLACVLYELLAGDPPFTGRTPQAVLAKVLGEAPSSVRTVRPDVPAHVDAALMRALAKLPVDRQSSAREFADALQAGEAVASGAASANALGELAAPAHAPPRGRATWWRGRTGPVMVGAFAASLAAAAWIAARRDDGSGQITVIPYRNLVEETQFAAVTMTPNGRALVYTGAADAGRPLMLWPLDERAGRVVAGTAGGMEPAVSPDGRRLLFRGAGGRPSAVALEGLAATRPRRAWQFGSSAWIGDSAYVVAGGKERGLYRYAVGAVTATMVTRPDSAQGETRHLAPLILPGGEAMVFTVSKRAGQGLVVGALAIASLDSVASRGPRHVLLDVTARRAVAFVDGWLLYTSADGKAIMASRLDVPHRRITGTPVLVRKDDYGNLETAVIADNGSLLYLRRPRSNSAVLVDTGGGVRRGFSNPQGPFMNPRLSPDGKRFAVQVSSATGEDVWLYDIASGSSSQLTTSGTALQPTWTPDGRRIVYMRGMAAGLMLQPVDGGAPDTLAGTRDAFAPTVSPDGRSVVFLRRVGTGTLWSAPVTDTGVPKKVVDNAFANNMAAFAPNGRWMAYVSRVGKANGEVWVRPYPGPGTAVQVSDSSGTEPAWSPDGRRIYYRSAGWFMAATVTTTPYLAVVARTRLFADSSDNTMPHRNYDVTRDGTGFLMIAPSSTARPEAVLILNWLGPLRELLAQQQ